MTPTQWERVPENLLSRRDTGGLIAFLGARGWHCSLIELADERKRRRVTNYRKASR